MKEKIRKILENTYAYNVENDRVIEEILSLFRDGEINEILKEREQQEYEAMHGTWKS